MTDELTQARLLRRNIAAQQAPAPAPATSPRDETSDRGGGAPSGQVEALLAMATCVSDFGLAELERLAAALLVEPATTPAEQRVAELWHLAQLLESELAGSFPHDRIAPVQVSREDYDRTRPHAAPTSETLTKRYGSAGSNGWAWACRAAWGLLPDGRKTKPGLGWPSALRGQPRKPRSTRDYAINSVRQCALELLRQPSSNVYIEWHNAWRRRRDAEAGGGQASEAHRHEPATIAAIYQQFPKGWTSALAAADVTDRELEGARARLLAGRTLDARPVDAPATPADRLAALDGDQLAACGHDATSRERLLRKGFGGLTLTEAARLAQALDGSLGWLAGMDAAPGQPPATEDVGLDAGALRAAARRRGLSLEGLRRGARMDVGSWRAVTAGRREATVEQLRGWAQALRVPLEELTRC